jgi:hypothetical protein
MFEGSYTPVLMQGSVDKLYNIVKRLRGLWPCVGHEVQKVERRRCRLQHDAG